ncbi:MAG: hypothetical protein JWR32_1313 [Mycobacterium sp.]|jgi:hypothetical protein|nr:hypothetical protein [Mycobacterium sp.]
MVNRGANRPDTSQTRRMKEYRRGDLVFDVIGAGPGDGPVAVLRAAPFSKHQMGLRHVSAYR